MRQRQRPGLSSRACACTELERAGGSCKGRCRSGVKNNVFPPPAPKRSAVRDFHLMTAHSFPGPALSSPGLMSMPCCFSCFLFIHHPHSLSCYCCSIDCPGRAHTQACVSRAEEMKSGGRDPIKGLGQRCDLAFAPFFFSPPLFLRCIVCPCAPCRDLIDPQRLPDDDRPKVPRVVVCSLARLIKMRRMVASANLFTPSPALF